MSHEAELRVLCEEIVRCRACPRLVAWRERVAVEKRASFASEDYWGRPIPGFGDPAAGMVIVGLAPAAHGGNRTGRVFTGDRSGDFLFASLYRTGYANQPTATHRDDGLELTGAYIIAAVRCAPPANKPTPMERDTCFPYLTRELELLDRTRVIVPLGQFAFDAVWRALAALGHPLTKPRPRFGHGAEMTVEPAERDGRGDGRPAVTVLCSYHPSQQNTFTGKLTEPMLDEVFIRAATLAREVDR